jgi:membrane fusion protein (multidrug efflux system)
VIREKKVIYIFIFALSIILLIAYKLFSKKTKIEDNSFPPVIVAKAELGPVVRYINAIGTLRPFDSVVIKSEVNSVISKIHFTEGTSVEENSLLIELDDANAKAALMEAEASYRRAKSQFEPVEKLADKGVMARIKRDELKAEMDMAEAKVLSHRNNLEKHKIFAPFKGVVGLKEISKGQYAAQGAELVKLVNCHPLKVDFKVAEVDVGNVYVGQEIKVLVGGDDTQEYSAKIIAVDPESDKISHSFNVRALLDIPEEVSMELHILKPGRFVSVKVVPDDNQNGILIPEACIEKIGDEALVYRIIDGVAIRTIVTAGMRRDGLVEIITGINEGDIVIKSGQANVLDGRGVSIQDPNAKNDTLAKLQKAAASPPKKKTKGKKNVQKTQSATSLKATNK